MTTIHDSTTINQTGHTMTITETAYSLIPGYTEARSTQTALQRRSNDFPNIDIGGARQELRAAIRAALVNDTELPLDAGREFVKLEHEARVAEIFREESKHLRELSRETISRLVAHETTDALSYLNSELDKLVQQIREQQRSLGDARTGSEAIARGPKAVQAWATISGLIDLYDEIRTVQLELTRSALEANFTDIFYSTALYRDAIDASSYWLNRRHNAATQSTLRTSEHTRWLNSTRVAIGTFDSDGSWWPRGDRTEALLRIATHARPWVPDTATLKKAHAAAHRAVTPVRPVLHAADAASEANIAHALTQYEAITSGQHETFLELPAPDLTKHHRIAKRIQERTKQLQHHSPTS